MEKSPPPSEGNTKPIYPEANRVNEILEELRSYRNTYKHGSKQRYEYNKVCDELAKLSSHLLNEF